MLDMDLIFYLTLALFILLFGTLDNNIDYDFWARLIVGKNFFQTGTLFDFDFQSWGSTHKFIDHEWGSSLIFYLIQNHFGDIGIYFFKSIIIFLTIFTITRIIRLENKKASFHFLFFFFALQAITYNIFSTIRCQTFSFLFFAIYLYILKKASCEKNYKILWCIPILNIIWTNLHGGFVVGIIITLIYAIGEYLNKKEYKPYIITFALTLLTSLINPYGLEYISFIISALSLNRTYITEWQSLFFSKYYQHILFKYELFFIISIATFIIVFLKNVKQKNLIKHFREIDKTKYLIIIFALLISLKSIRFHVFFVYTVIAFCYNDFYNIFNKKLPINIDNAKEIILFILILISTTSHIIDYKFINIVKPSEYPIFCTEFIKINNLKGNVFTIFHTGSYVSYKLYPNNQIFMDGRYEEVYDIDLINQMAKVFLAKDYNNFFEKNHTDILIIDNSYPIYEKLKKDSNWFLAYEDKNFSVFLPIQKKNKNFILPEKDLNYYNKTKFETSINWL